MAKPVNSNHGFTPIGVRGGNSYLLESVQVESKNNSLRQAKSRAADGKQYEALAVATTRQTSRRPTVLSTRKPSKTTNSNFVNQGSSAIRKDGTSGNSSRNSVPVVEQQKTTGSNAANSDVSSTGTGTDLAQNTSNTVSPQVNQNAKPVAPTASSIAKERSVMNSTLNNLLQSILGKEGFVPPTDHRGYTAMIAKAIRKIKDPAQLEAFKSKVEEAGKPFRLNFGISRTVGEKKEALNSKETVALSSLHQGEYQKIAAELNSKTTGTGKMTPNGTGQSTGSVNQVPTAAPTVSPAPTQTPTPATAQPETPSEYQKTSSSSSPESTEGEVSNPSLYDNPELIA
jgi:hypothetical protein